MSDPEIDPELLRFGTRTRGPVLIGYAYAMRGRMLDLPRSHHIMIAESVVRAHPKWLPRAMWPLLVGERFRRSVHTWLRNVPSPAELRRVVSQYDRRHWSMFGKEGRQKRRVAEHEFV